MQAEGLKDTHKGMTTNSTLKDTSSKPPAQLPPIMPPTRLVAAWKQYLFRKIRPISRPGTEDLIAPNPDSNSATGE